MSRRKHKLRRGDLVKLVEHHLALDGTEGYSIEVFNAVGETVDVVTVRESQIERLTAGELLSRRVAQAAPR